MKTLLFTLLFGLLMLAGVDTAVAQTAPCPPIDTISSISDIIGGGVYYFENIPESGSGLDVWAAYIVGVLGFVFGIVRGLKGSKGSAKA